MEEKITISANSENEDVAKITPEDFLGIPIARGPRSTEIVKIFTGNLQVKFEAENLNEAQDIMAMLRDMISARLDTNADIFKTVVKSECSVGADLEIFTDGK